MVLLAPSIRELQILICTYEQYVNEHGMIYKDTKTQLVVFRQVRGLNVVPPVRLTEILLPPPSNIRGTLYDTTSLITTILTDRGELSPRANTISRRLHNCDERVKKIIFHTFCMIVMYTNELWCNYTHTAINEIRVLYKNTLRIIFKMEILIFGH